ncbi:MAG TPA: glycosyltransferase [Tepidisphaeraceae bacterium]|jgi:GT2 family glycosyltransferase
MISIIICSIDDARFATVSANFANLLNNEPHEIIRIPDARSMCEGYTRGVAKSRGETLIFCHDDIEILNQDFAARLKEHMGKYDLVGVAGASRLIRAEWVAAGPPYIFGQVAQNHPEQGFVVRIFGVPARSVGGIHAMDGLFFAARRDVAEKIPFDAQTFDGFHHYDLDFSYAAHLAGYQLGIANDIHIIHRSLGMQDKTWKDYARKFDQKYAGRLNPMPARRFFFAWVRAKTREEVMEIMSATCPP